MTALPEPLQRTPRHAEHPAQRERRQHFQWWRREQALREYRRWVDRHPAGGSVDGYKDRPRQQSLGGYNADCLRTNGRAALIAEKKTALRTRWALPSYADLRVK